MTFKDTENHRNCCYSIGRCCTNAFDVPVGLSCSIVCVIILAVLTQLVQVLSPAPSVSLYVSPVHCEKPAYCIWMSFGLVGRLGPRTRQLDVGADHLMGWGNFGGGCG